MLLFSWYDSVASSLTCYFYVSNLLSSATDWLLHTLLFSPTEWLQLSSTHLTEWRQCVNCTILCILFTLSERLFQECTSSSGLENVCPWDPQNEGVAIVSTVQTFHGLKPQEYSLTLSQQWFWYSSAIVCTSQQLVRITCSLAWHSTLWYSMSHWVIYVCHPLDEFCTPWMSPSECPFVLLLSEAHTLLQCLPNADYTDLYFVHLIFFIYDPPSALDYIEEFGLSGWWCSLCYVAVLLWVCMECTTCNGVHVQRLL